MSNHIELIRLKSKEYCEYETIIHLQEMLRTGKITREHINSVLDLLDFDQFIDKIEAMHTKYATEFGTEDVGEYIANEFSVIFLIKDALEDWKTKHLIPLVKFVQQ